MFTYNKYTLGHIMAKGIKACIQRQASIRQEVASLLSHYKIPIEVLEPKGKSERLLGETVFIEANQETSQLSTVIRITNEAPVEVLTEELAHVAIEFATPTLRQRLSNALPDATVKGIIKEEHKTYSELYEGSQDLLRREAMAKLLTKHILGQYEGKHSSFLSRIWQAIKDLFHGITDGVFLNEVERTDRLFRDYASKIVAKKALLSNEHLSEIVKGKSLYAAIANSAGIKNQVEGLVKIAKTMKSRVNAFYSQSVKRGDLLKTDLNEDRANEIDRARNLLGVASGRVESALGTAIAVDAIDNLIEGLTALNDYASMVAGQMGDLETILKSSDKDLVAYNTSASLLRNMYMVLYNLEENEEIADQIIRMLSIKSGRYSIQMSEAERERLIEFAERIESKIAENKSEVAASLDKYNLKEKMAGIIIDQIIGYFVDAKDGNGNKLFASEEEARAALKGEILHDLGKYSSKNNIFSAFLTPVATNGDLIHTLMSRFIKVTEAKANAAVLERTKMAEEKLMEIKKKYNLENESQWALMRDEKGRITGEIVTPHKWLEFEAEKQKIAEKVDKELNRLMAEYRKANNAPMPSGSIQDRRRSLEMVYTEEWEREHGSKFTEKYIVGKNKDGYDIYETLPGSFFDNEAYDKLSDGQKEFVDMMYDLKESLDLWSGLKPEPWKAPLVARRGSSKELNPFKRIAATNWKQYILGGVIGIEEFEGVHTSDPLGTLLFVHKPKGYTQFGLELSKNPDVDYQTDPIGMMKAYAASSAYYTRMAAIKHIVELTRILDVENRGYNRGYNGRTKGGGRNKMADYDAFVNRTIYEKNVINERRSERELIIGAIAYPLQQLVYISELILNILSGIKGVFNGITRAWMLADRRSGYTAASLRKAILVAQKDIYTRWKFNKRGIVEDPLTATLILIDSGHNCREHFMQGSISSQRAVASLFSISTLAFPLSITYKMMKHIFALAYLMNIKAGEVSRDIAPGIEALSLYDYMKNLKIPEGGKMTKFVEESLMAFSGAKTKEEMYDWLGGHSQRHLLNTQRTIGAYNATDRAAASSYSIGKLLLIFRNWLPVIIADAFRGTKYNTYTQEFEEGMYTTMWKMFNSGKTSGGSTIQKIQRSALTAAIAVGGPLMVIPKLRERVQEHFALSDMQANNLIRMARSMLIVHVARAITDTLFVATLAYGFDDENDETSWADKLYSLAIHFIASLILILGPMAIKTGLLRDKLHERIYQNAQVINTADPDVETSINRNLNRGLNNVSPAWIQLYGISHIISCELYPDDPIAYAVSRIQNNTAGDGAGMQPISFRDFFSSMYYSGLATLKVGSNIMEYIGDVNDTFWRFITPSYEGKKKIDPKAWEKERVQIAESNDSPIIKAWLRYKNDMINGSSADRFLWNSIGFSIVARNFIGIPLFVRGQIHRIKWQYNPINLVAAPSYFFEGYVYTGAYEDENSDYDEDENNYEEEEEDYEEEDYDMSIAQ